MGERLERFKDIFRVTPQAVVEQRILEAFKAGGVTEVDESQIKTTVDQLYPPKNWRDNIRIGRIRSGLFHLEREGLVERKRLTDENHSLASLRYVYRRADPQTPA